MSATNDLTVTAEAPAERPAVAPASVLRIPAKVEEGVEIRFAPLTDRDKFNPAGWRKEPLKPSFDRQGYYEIDLNQLKLRDGAYEYEFILDGRVNDPVPDPYAEEITRFGGYRGIFRIKGGKRWRLPFSWKDEFPQGVKPAQNHQLVIYEMPMRWMESAPERIRQIGLGTFERAVFMRLDKIAELGINAVELLPVQDSADTLNWGYGTRFFFAPDIDMGTPIDLKFFVKQCHRRGIRVIFDVVMNHDRDCPLRKLNYDDFFLSDPQKEEPGRGDAYSGKLFRYRQTAADGHFAAREFHFQMARFMIREYHADGFRIDEFRGIDNWEFVQQFRDQAWQAHQRAFVGRPFVVIAEDSWRRAAITQDAYPCPGDRKVTDAMWNFAFRDEVRRVLRNQIHTQWGQPSRSDRIRWAVSGGAVWDDLKKSGQPGFSDMAQAVNYLTSHDVEKDHEKRIMNYLFSPILRERGYGHALEDIRWVADHLTEGDGERADEGQRFAHGEALERIRSAFGLLLTSVGIPMILAGDEFGDVHDLDHTNWRLKMSDPVDWDRRDRWENNRRLCADVGRLIELRKSHPALLRNEVEFFYFHPAIDENDGHRVFAYCRSRGKKLGSRRQVVVVANAGRHDFGEFHLPWYWRNAAHLEEVAPPTYRAPLDLVPGGDWARLSLAPFQVRVFTT
jgi:1,4-alpha-glucan branching enzyme